MSRMFSLEYWRLLLGTGSIFYKIKIVLFFEIILFFIFGHIKLGSGSRSIGSGAATLSVYNHIIWFLQYSTYIYMIETQWERSIKKRLGTRKDTLGIAKG
jgi:hypothetical protein